MSSPHAHTTTATSPLSRRQIMTILAGLMVGMFMAALDQSVVSSSIYTIANDLNGLSMQAWATTAYLVTETVMMPLYGKLSDIYGRRPLYLIAIAIFLGASIYAGTVHSMEQLALARALQGIGAGGLMSLGLAIIGDIVPFQQRGKYQGYFMSIFGVSSVLGPVIGGFFAGADQILWLEGWRWVFLINVPLSLVAFATVWRFLHLPHKGVRQKIDYWGAAAIVLAVVPLLLVAEQGRVWGWSSPSSLLCFALGAIGIVSFIIAERAAGDTALMPLRFFRQPTFGISSLLNFMIGMAMFGSLAVLPLYLQIVRGLTPTEAGLLLVPLTVGILGGAMVSGRIISNSGRYRMFPLMGTVVMALASLAMGLFLDPDVSLVLLGGLSLAFGVGLGLCLQALTLSMQVSVAPKDLGMASSAATFFRSMGGAMGTAVFLSMLFNLATAKASALLEAAFKDTTYLSQLRSPATMNNPDNAGYLEFLNTARSGGSVPELNDTSWLRTADASLTRPLREAFAESMDVVMVTTSILLGLAFVIAFFLPRKRLVDPNQAPTVKPQDELLPAGAGSSGSLNS